MHRAAARQARRAAAQQRGRPAPVAEALPWVRPSVEVVSGDAGPATGRRAADAGLPRDRPRPSQRHGRALAVLGVAGVLATGYAATDARPDPSPAVRATPEWEAADAWAQRAAVALASVNRELDLLAQAEVQWRQLPEDRRAVVPAPVAALQERRSVLQQRRAMLRSQLDAYRSLRRVQQELAVSEQHLRAVEHALADTPADGGRSVEQEAAHAALNEQRDLRLRRRDAQRAELASLQDGVAAAVRTPLPDDAAATARISRDVLEVARDGGVPPTTSAAPVGPAEDVRPNSATGGPSVTSGPSTSVAPSASAGRDSVASTTPPVGRAPTIDGIPEDVLAELRERAARVARDARTAEAARRAGTNRP